MQGTPQISVGRLRKAVREVCNAAPGYGKTEQLLTDGIYEITRTRVPLEDLRRAIEWNHSEAYIRQEKNKDTDEQEWFITEHGQAKERI